MFKSNVIFAGFAAIALAATSASAETIRFEGVQFEPPADMMRYDGPPRPNGPFLRFRNGIEGDAQFDVIEVMVVPEAALQGRVTREGFAAYSLRPAEMYCGEHQVLWSETRTNEGVTIADYGFSCLRHARSPELSRQMVRNIAVFHDDEIAMIQFVGRWRNGPASDQELSAEAWVERANGFASSIQLCAEAC